jgi:hypothetical protein
MLAGASSPGCVFAAVADNSAAAELAAGAPSSFDKLCQHRHSAVPAQTVTGSP